ncbi:ricin B lectin domain-containing protein [Zopfochytrium polystomum]|nr:ricin B lectin domain-containing protein [Zopfochytrium polystomum]
MFLIACLRSSLLAALWSTIFARNLVSAQLVTTPCSMLVQVNKYRQSVGSPPLTLDRRLVAAAQAHSEDMSSKNVMMHDSTDGTFWGTRVASYFLFWSFLAENVAMWCYNESIIMDAWIASPEHEQNLRDTRAKLLGSGFMNGFWTQDFGTATSSDTPFPIDCTKESGYAWPQPVTAGSTFVGQLRTAEQLCLDSAAGLGGTLKANTCNKGTVSQSWTLKPKGAGFIAQVTGTNLCMDVFGMSKQNGSAVGIWSCTGNPNQQFMQNDKGSFVAYHSGLCVELPVAGIVHPSGTAVGQWKCNGGRNQAISPVDPVAGSVKQPYGFVGTVQTTDGLCVDSANGLGGMLMANKCTGSSTQKWTLKQVGSYFTLQSAGGSACVDVFSNSVLSGAKVGLWNCTAGLNQQWVFSSTAGLINLNSGKCLDLPGTSPRLSGTAFFQQTCNGGSSQALKLV